MLLLLHLSTPPPPPPPPKQLTSLSSPNSAALLSHSSINPFTLSFSNSPPLISTTKPFSSSFSSSCHSSAHHESSPSSYPSALFPSPLIAEDDGAYNNNGNCSGGGNSGGGGGGGGEFSGFGFPSWDMALYWLLIHGNNRNRKRALSYFLLFSSFNFLHFFSFEIPAALAKTENPEVIWEVKGGKWRRLVPDAAGDSFVVDSVLGGGIEKKDQSEEEGKCSKGLVSGGGVGIVVRLGFCKEFVLGLMLPEGYPQSVSSDYLEYCLWRGVQGVASQINGVLTTQALLYAIGLGKGAIPTAAAISWVLKDGIGYLSKIFLSKFGRHFDVHPKGWRLFADLLENAAYGLELLTPTFPEFFVVIGSVAGASRSAASLIQAATRSCFYAGFAAQRNFAEVIAKGEAQGMVSKSVGIVLGIALANYVSSSGTLTALSFSVVTVLHMICNVKSYQSIQLRNLNPLRASLFFSEYLISGSVPSVREVNDNEPLFPGFPVFMMRTMHQGQVLSEEAKGAATHINQKLQLGSKLSEVVDNAEEALALFNLFKDEGYIVTEYKGLYHVVLKEGSSPEDMLKSLFLINYMNWLERRMGMDSRGTANDCRTGGKLRLSYEYVQREFNHVKHAGKTCGWDTDGLVARPLPYKIRIG